MNLHRLQPVALAAALLALSPLAGFSLPAHNVPNGVALAHYESRVDPAKEMNLTITLKMHDEAGFDRALEELQDPASSRYHQWFTDEDFAKYEPTPAEFETVKNELLRQGFTLVSSDPRRFSIRVHGTAAIAERAFHTELHNLSYNGRTFQAHVRDARLDGPAGDVIDGISGLERHQSRPQLSILRNPRTGKPFSERRLTGKESLASFASSFTATPLSTATTQSFTTFGAEPTASFTGIGYAANGKMGGLNPANLEAHYGLTSLISGGFNGAGQTIALVEGYGYPNAEADANIAAKLFGLPTFSSANFSVVYPEGAPINRNAGIISGWDGEIALDIQSAHATAPKAKIVVVASSGQDNEDQIASLSYVISPNGSKTPLAYTVSSSWENDSEIISGVLELQAFDSVLKTGAAAGISFQFSSGDGGDLGLGTPVGAVSIPADDPHVTAVGGTSVLNNPYTNATVVTGWGSNQVFLFQGGLVSDPLEGYFAGGAGGGQSQYFKKPAWQSKLAGSWRQVPDVAAVADPATGFPVILTEFGKTTGQIIGGTSLASPVFTAIWAIADQFNGAPLGQAAPLISKLSAVDISDVVAPGASLYGHDVTGSIKDTDGTHNFTAKTIFTSAGDLDNQGSNLSLYSQSSFISAIWPAIPGTSGLDFAISFGTDSSLTVGKGWDNVTGWGEPNGLPFIQGVTGKITGVVDGKK
jgi:subtilase family serine protease